MKKRVLVSGGAGYIGSHVTVELVNAGYDVLVADNMSNCDMTCFEGVKKITGKDDIPFECIDCCDDALHLEAQEGGSPKSKPARATQ